MKGVLIGFGILLAISFAATLAYFTNEPMPRKSNRFIPVTSTMGPQVHRVCADYDLVDTETGEQVGHESKCWRVVR